MNSLKMVTSAAAASVTSAASDFQRQQHQTQSALIAALHRRRQDSPLVVASKSRAYDAGAAGCSTQRGLQIMRLSARMERNSRVLHSLATYERVVASLAASRTELTFMDHALLSLLRFAVAKDVVLDPSVVDGVCAQLWSASALWLADAKGDDGGSPDYVAAQHWQRELAPQLAQLRDAAVWEELGSFDG